MPRSCPWCREPLGLASRRALQCPHCGRSLIDGDGRELRDLDLRYEQVIGREGERFRQMLLVGTPIVAVLVIVLPVLHLGAVAAAPLLVVAHLVAVRIWLLRDISRLLGARRRRFVRWFCRLTFLWVGVFGYGLAAAPLVGVVPGVITFAALTAAAHGYARWSLARERERAPLERWERIVLAGLVALTLAAAAVLAAAAALLGWSVGAVLEWLGR